LEINKTVIVASRWFLYYFTYIYDARSNTNQVSMTDLLLLLLLLFLLLLLKTDHFPKHSTC